MASSHKPTASASQFVAPLTKRRVDNGALYRRRPEVEAQILSLLALPPMEVCRLAGISDCREDTSLHAETLVYYIRTYWEQGYHEAVERLALTLYERSRKLFFNARSRFTSQADFEDIGQEVWREVFSKIMDLNSNAGDYAQCSFWAFLNTALVNRWRQYRKDQAGEQQYFGTAGEDEQGTPLQDIAAAGPSQEEALAHRELFNILPPLLFEVAVLRFLEGWEVENQDPAVPTLSRYFGKTPRTIRNWCAEIERTLKGAWGR